jgi:hypothetical protein
VLVVCCRGAGLVATGEGAGVSLDPAGRYRPVRTSLWPTFGGLSPDARLVLLALLTGSTSNLAGITFLARETLRRETGLDADQLEAALLELEKQPTPARSFIVRDELVIWCRDALRDAPRVLDERQRFASDLHRRGIKALLGSLPATSPTVQKFKRTYRLALQAPSEGVGQGVSQGARKVRRTDTDTDSDTENRDRRTDTEREIQEGKPNTAGDVSPAAPSVSLSLQSSDHDHVNPEEASTLASKGTTSSNGHSEPRRRFTRDEYDAELTATMLRHPSWPKDDCERRVAEVMTGRKEPLDRSRI